MLEAANLMSTVWRGREKLHYLNAAPLSEIAERWISRYNQARLDALADLKKVLEESRKGKPSFVYTTYIGTTPERLWQALTDSAFTRRYWETTFTTDWAPGSVMTWDNHGVVIVDPEQVVLVSEPCRRLSYTWHSFTPELAQRFGWGQKFLGRLAGERRSKVTFDIEQVEHRVKLTVIHDDFGPDSMLAETVTEGWPEVIASLKTLLETGTPLRA
ncbi:SRPBCC family protein [Nonomuraea thailandensis]